MPTILFPRFDFMHGRVKKKKQRVLAAVVLPRIDFMHGRLKIKIKTKSFRSSRTQIIGQYFFFLSNKKRGFLCGLINPMPYDDNK